MSKKKRYVSEASRSKAAPTSANAKAASSEAQKNEHSNLAKHSTFLVVFTAIMLLAIFAGRWIYAITNGYYDTFVNGGEAIETAVSNMRGLNLTGEEADQHLTLEKKWDLFISSHLEDEVTCAADDGTELHGYLLDRGSSTTVVYIPRFANDGTSDFLPGTWLGDELGCNLLLTDPRATGKSGGSVLSYGVKEQYDLQRWLTWAETELGTERFIIWGEGTGANTALFAAADGLLNDKVSLIVAESCYASLHELAERSIFRWFTVPAFPFLYTIEFKVDHSDTGYQVRDTDLVNVLGGAECSVPVLFLESTEDDYILPEWSSEVVSAYTGPKDEITAAGSHGMVYTLKESEIQDYIEHHLN